MDRQRLRLNDIEGLENTEVSTVVTSNAGVPLIVERTMTWDASGYGAHTEKASSGPALSWYFAEGSAGFFHTYLLLANPQGAANVATVTYLRENEPAFTREYPVPANGRFTVDTSADELLLNRSFGMKVTFAQPGMAERAMYFGDTPLWSGGHASAGATEPTSSWFLAEGATGPFFETFILLANPGAEDADVTITFLRENGGAPVIKTFTVPKTSRFNVRTGPGTEVPELADERFGAYILSSKAIAVERAMYSTGSGNPTWVAGTNASATRLDRLPD